VYPPNGQLTNWENSANPNSFCNQGGRFGAHASSELFYPPYYGRLAMVSWFSGGLQVFDIRNPDAARRIAYFIPAPVDSGCVDPNTGADIGCTFSNSGRRNSAGVQHVVNGIQTNNVEIDDRGYIYLADRAGTGMQIVKLTGAARRAARGERDDDDDDDHEGGHGDR
jgi:hypothetical protein